LIQEHREEVYVLNDLQEKTRVKSTAKLQKFPNNAANIAENSCVTNTHSLFKLAIFNCAIRVLQGNPQALYIIAYYERNKSYPITDVARRLGVQEVAATKIF
jgi:hypothetical protein